MLHNATEILKQKGIKITHHRAEIYAYLFNTKEHPTAERILDDLRKKMPTLSKATVYNTLDYFEKKGIIKMFIVDDKRHYDANVECHAHFHCVECGRVMDLDIPNLIEMHKATFRDKEVFNAVLIFNGICEDCLKKGGQNG